MRLFTAIRQGAEGPAAASYAAGLTGTQRRLLATEGSLTEAIESILDARVSVELKKNGITTLGPGLCAYLGLNPSDEAVEREVWLTSEGKRLVYACSVLPVACFGKRVLDILSRGREPLGRVLASEGLGFSRESLETGLILSEDDTGPLGLSGGPPFFARLYRLVIDSDSGRADGARACVAEVLSPELVRAAAGGRGRDGPPLP